jgi:hypothetical protein
MAVYITYGSKSVDTTLRAISPKTLVVPKRMNRCHTPNRIIYESVVIFNMVTSLSNTLIDFLNNCFGALPLLFILALIFYFFTKNFFKKDKY